LIVADTNLIAYLVISGERTELAEQVFRKDKLWAAPPLWRTELRSVLVQHMRVNSLPLRDCLMAIDYARAAIIAEYEVSDEEVLTLATSCACSAYDCEFIALAQRLGVPLVTYDRRVLAEFPEIAMNAETFLAQ